MTQHFVHTFIFYILCAAASENAIKSGTHRAPVQDIRPRKYRVCTSGFRRRIGVLWIFFYILTLPTIQNVNSKETKHRFLFKNRHNVV